MNQDANNIRSNATPLATIQSGYIGTPERWQLYFESVIADFGRDPAIHALTLAQEAYQSKKYISLLNDAEQRLRIKLPKSYKDFVVAGGIEFFNRLSEIFYFFDEEHDDVLFRPDQIGRWQDIYPEYYDRLFEYDEGIEILDTDYYLYNSYEEDKYTAADSFLFKQEHTNFINIGTWITNSGIDTYGLIDKEYTKDYEYEAWSFCPRNPGAYRYHSFAELCVFGVIRRLLSIDATETITETHIFNLSSTSLIFDIKILKEQWHPQTE